MNGPAMDEEERPVHFEVGTELLEGDLGIPANAGGIVLFTHGSGSNRNSPRHRLVAAELRKGGLATLRFDLLTSEEAHIDLLTRYYRFNVDLLSERLTGATDWLYRNAETRNLAIGYFGASTGAAAALRSATTRPQRVRAVVTRGGRPDLAADVLPKVHCPTLMIVGGNDPTILRLNQHALERLRCHSKMEIIPGASHLFEEPGALEEVARLAREWFKDYLVRESNGL